MFRPRHLHLTIENRSGSVEHYWHFMMGFYLPLIHFHQSLGFLGRRTTQLYIRSCGPMNRHLEALGWRGLNILEKRAHHAAFNSAGNQTVESVTLHGIDMIPFYDFALMRHAADYLLRHLGGSGAASGSSVLLIDRGQPNPFYLAENAEIPGSSNTRRSIPNIQAVFDGVQAVCADSALRQLEAVSMAEQIALYRQARVVVFQCGAALANLVFCKPGSTVIEVVPDDLHPDYVEMGAKLCQGLALKYLRVRQESKHAAVDPAAVAAAVSAALLPD